ncbi:MAG: hypothetical protein AB7O78_03665 [Thermoleophilia bacterium]
MTRTTTYRAVLAFIVLGAAPLVAAERPGGEPATSALPVLDLTLRDDAVAGLPGVVAGAPTAVRVTNEASGARTLSLARLDGDHARVVTRTATLAPGAGQVVRLRLTPGRWLAAEGGVSRGPVAATLVPAPASGAPR